LIYKTTVCTTGVKLTNAIAQTKRTLSSLIMPASITTNLTI